MKLTALQDLRRATALFQQRALCLAMGVPAPEVPPNRVSASPAPVLDPEATSGRGNGEGAHRANLED